MSKERARRSSWVGALDLVWTLWRRENYTAPAGNKILDSSVVQFILFCGIINNILGLMDPHVVFKGTFYLCVNI
jgi:hypothetical protein